jgi:hypothetical protein
MGKIHRFVLGNRGPDGVAALLAPTGHSKHNRIVDRTVHALAIRFANMMILRY